MNIVGYYVTKGSVPCAFQNATGSYRGGLLVPVNGLIKPSPAPLPATAFFNKLRDARRAMNRSRHMAESVKTSAPWLSDVLRKQVPSYFDGEPFAIWPLGKQLAGLPAEPKPKDSAIEKFKGGVDTALKPKGKKTGPGRARQNPSSKK